MIKRDRPHDRVTNLSGPGEAELSHKTVVGDCLSSTVNPTDLTSWWISWSRQVPRLTCFHEQVGWWPWLILINRRVILISVLINHKMVLIFIQRTKLLPGHTSFQCQGGRWSHQGGNPPPLSARRTSEQSMGTPGQEKYFIDILTNIFVILTWAGLITTVFPAARQAAIFHESIIRG